MISLTECSGNIERSIMINPDHITCIRPTDLEAKASVVITVTSETFVGEIYVKDSLQEIEKLLKGKRLLRG